MFDVKAFTKAQYQPRTEEVPMPLLKQFFPDDAKPVFTVRGLTGEEMARCRESQTKLQGLQDIVQALAGEDRKEKINALREALGLSYDSIPVDLARRIEAVALGSVEPELDQQVVVKLFQVDPVGAYNLSTKIFDLSGHGQVVGERKASGKNQTSEQPAT